MLIRSVVTSEWDRARIASSGSACEEAPPPCPREHGGAPCIVVAFWRVGAACLRAGRVCCLLMHGGRPVRPQRDMVTGTNM